MTCFPSVLSHGSDLYRGRRVTWTLIASSTTSGSGTSRVFRPFGYPQICLFAGSNFT